jgi:hypothetical protein
MACVIDADEKFTSGKFAADVVAIIVDLEKGVMDNSFKYDASVNDL